MPHTTSLLGVPVASGADFETHTGVRQGPDAVRDANLVKQLQHRGLTVNDNGNITENDLVTVDDVDAVPSTVARYAATTTQRVSKLREQSDCVAVLGGDHTTAIGAVNGTAHTQDSTGLLWLDAHADFNTPTSSITGNVHGMPVAALLGHDAFAHVPWADAPGLTEENVAMIGLRSVDEPEWDRLEDSNVSVYTMQDIVDRGLLPVLRDALQSIGDVNGVHVSLDMDWFNPGAAPGVGTPVRGGVMEREGVAAAQLLHDTGEVVSLDVSEVNPRKDDTDQTPALAAHMVTVLCGGNAYTTYYD